MPRPVFTYDSDTHGSTRLLEVVGTSPRGDPELKPLSLTTPEDPSIPIKVQQPSGERYYRIVKLEGEDLDEATGRLEASGVSLKEKPIFVSLVLPGK